ncbi:MAG: hypothetical protein ACLSAH_07685 [Bilophila wadsworthia]
MKPRWGGFRLPCVTPEPEVQDVDHGAGDEGQRQAQKENPSDVRADEQHEAGILTMACASPIRVMQETRRAGTSRRCGL